MKQIKRTYLEPSVKILFAQAVPFCGQISTGTDDVFADETYFDDEEKNDLPKLQRNKFVWE